MSTSRSLVRAATGMGVATAISRLFGSVRVLVIAAVLGTTFLGNTFTSSNAVSNVLFELLAAGALSAVLVPTFVARFARGEHERAEHVAGGLLGVGLAGLAVVAVAGVVFAPLLADLLTTTVDDPQVAARQQELATFLLRFFVPQVLLYAVGAVATAVLHARSSFVVPAVAPVGNTVVLVAALVVFALVAGPDPGLELSFGEQLLLAAGGTLGVAAFTAVPVMALARQGFRLRPRWAADDPDVRRVLRLSGWAAVQHSGAGLLLGAAIVVGGGVEGGVVAYQVAWVTFLAPYGILAQPIHTAILPRLSTEAATGDGPALARSVRWGLDAMAVAVLPVSAAVVALSVPVMSVVAFGQATAAGGVGLMAAGVAGLAIGLFPYGAFLLLARVWYALDDSRTPAVAALGSALAGVALMAVAGGVADGAGLVFALGLGHSVAYGLGAIGLAVGLRRRAGVAVLPHRAPLALAAAAGVGLAGWAAMEGWAPEGRLATLAALAVIGGAGLGLYLALARLLRAFPTPLSEPVPAVGAR